MKRVVDRKRVAVSVGCPGGRFPTLCRGAKTTTSIFSPLVERKLSHRTRTIFVEGQQEKTRTNDDEEFTPNWMVITSVLLDHFHCSSFPVLVLRVMCCPGLMSPMSSLPCSSKRFSEEQERHPGST